MTNEHCVFEDNISSSLDKDDTSSVERVMEFPLSDNDNIRVVKNVLSENECHFIIGAVQLRGVSPPSLFDKNVRDCQRRHTVDVQMSNIIFPRLKPFLPEIVNIDGARWKLNRFTHHWRYVRYGTGGKFLAHWDGSKLLPTHEMTLFTVQIYLNESFEGGSTRFYSRFSADQGLPHDIPYGKSHPVCVADRDISVSVQPRQGSALIFNHSNHSLLHDGEVVNSGVKYIVRSDVLYSAIREDIPRLISFTQEMRSRNIPTTWCTETAARYATKNFVGEVWVCWCALDRTGTDAEMAADEVAAEKPIQGGPLLPMLPHQRRKSLNSCAVCQACLLPSAQVKPVLSTASSCTQDSRARVTASTKMMSVEFPHVLELKQVHQLDAKMSTPDKGVCCTDCLDTPRVGPRLILISGKRAAGKDFVGERIVEMLGQEKGISAVKVSLGEINKQICAQEMSLDYERLLRDREYKERYRVAMVQSHANRDSVDPLWCIKAVLSQDRVRSAQMAVISDIRMKNDLESLLYDTSHLNEFRTCVAATLRVQASDEARASRGWRWDSVKDNLPTETDLDTYTGWTAVIDNSCLNDDTDTNNMIIDNWIMHSVFPRLCW